MAVSSGDSEWTTPAAVAATRLTHFIFPNFHGLTPAYAHGYMLPSLRD